MAKKPSRAVQITLLILSLAISALVVVNKDSFSGLQNYGYIGIFILSVIGNATVIIPAPVVLTALIGGSIFNPFAVGVITALGATLGELTGFLAGYGGKALMEDNKHYQKIKSWILNRGFLTIFLLAVIPNPLFDIAGIVSGATGYPVQRFLVATFLGKTIKFVLIALLGSSVLA